MLYLLAFFVPPLAVLLCGKPFTAIANAVVWLVSIGLMLVGIGVVTVWISVIHAMIVVGSHKADKRAKAQAAAIGQAVQGRP